MANLGTVTTRNQITIPAEIRPDMEIAPGDRIIIRSTGPGVFEIKSISRMTFEDSLELFRIEGPIDWDQLQRDIEEDISADVMRTCQIENP